MPLMEDWPQPCRHDLAEALAHLAYVRAMRDGYRQEVCGTCPICVKAGPLPPGPYAKQYGEAGVPWAR